MGFASDLEQKLTNETASVKEVLRYSRLWVKYIIYRKKHRDRRERVGINPKPRSLSEFTLIECQIFPKKKAPAYVAVVCGRANACTRAKNTGLHSCTAKSSFKFYVSTIRCAQLTFAFMDAACSIDFTGFASRMNGD